MHAYAPDTYVAADLSKWEAIATRQAAKDQILIPRLARQFVPGRILELGSGAGQIARILIRLGYPVLGSDYAQFFVDHLRRNGLPAERVDATDITAAGVGRFANIFSQSITPFITTDESVISRAYRSSVDALMPGGRFVMIHAMAPRSELAATIRQHRRLAEAAGLTQVRIVREQLLPSIGYRPPFTPVAAVLESALGPWLGSRFTLVGTRPA